MKNIPIMSCPHGGESYLTADILHEVERLSFTARAFVERPVEVMSFG